MKTEQEQIEKMTSIIVENLQDKRVENGTTFVTYLPSLFGNNPDKEKEVAEALIKNGYGDVSEYKAEIERLKAGTKQAKLNILGKLWSNISNSKQLIQSYIADGSFTIEDIYMEIDELMAEVENEN